MARRRRVLTVVVSKVEDLPEDWRARLQELCNPTDFAMWRWLFQSGPCYATVIGETHAGSPLLSRQILGWAGVTFNDGPNPVLGVFVDEHRRGEGLGVHVAAMALSYLSPQIKAAGGVVAAVARRWPKYPALIEAAGFSHVEWD